MSLPAYTNSGSLENDITGERVSICALVIRTDINKGERGSQANSVKIQLIVGLEKLSVGQLVWVRKVVMYQYCHCEKRSAVAISPLVLLSFTLQKAYKLLEALPVLWLKAAIFIPVIIVKKVSIRKISCNGAAWRRAVQS